MSRMEASYARAREKSAYLRTRGAQYVDAGGLLVHHVRAGTGMPVVLVHGGGMWLYSYRHLIDPLSRTREVHALDLPGYGYTVIRDHHAAMDLGSMTGTLRAYLDARGIGRASFVGHSWGGGWVLAFALAFPHMVDRIVLIDSSGLDVPDALEWELLKIPFIGAAFLRILTPGMVRRRLMKSFHDTSQVDRAMALEVYLPLCIPSNRKAQALVSRNLSWKGVERSLPALTHRTLLIWGAQDRYLDASLTRRFSERIPGLRVEIIQGCGHSPHEERPGAVVDLLRGFLGPR